MRGVGAAGRRDWGGHSVISGMIAIIEIFTGTTAIMDDLIKHSTQPAEPCARGDTVERLTANANVGVMPPKGSGDCGGIDGGRA